MKKNKELFIGILVLIITLILGVITSIIVVESTVYSSASNDGWLGFLGGLFGSLISGFVAIYILYINRTDADKSQKENFDKSTELQMEALRHQEKMQMDSYRRLEIADKKREVDEVFRYIMEYLSLINDYYLHVADNTKHLYDKDMRRLKEIDLYFQIHLQNSSCAEGITLYQTLIEFKAQFLDDKNIFNRDVFQINSEIMKTLNTFKKYSDNFINPCTD